MTPFPADPVCIMRHAFTILLSAALVSGCASSTQLPLRSAVDSPCRPSDLPACEAGLSESLRAAFPAKWARAYIDARADALGSDDPWVKLFSSLEGAGKNSIVVLSDPGQSSATLARIQSEFTRQGNQASELVVIDTPALPATTNISEPDLLLALAQEVGLEQLAWTRNRTLYRALGKDGLAPLANNLPPIILESLAGKEEDLVTPLVRGIRIDRWVNEVVALLAKGSYREAGDVTLALHATLETEPPDRASSLRGRLLLARASSFGASVPLKENTEGKEPWERGSPGQGAYIAFLRVLLASDLTVARKAWATQRPEIATALNASRLGLLDMIYRFDSGAKGQRCELERRALPEEVRSEPFFANRLAYQAKSGTISPAEWSRAYDDLVKEIEESGMAWAFLPSLLAERGELPGMSAKGSNTYRRVTRMTVDHLRSLEEFQKAAPERYSPGGQLTIGLQQGALTDAEILDVTQRLAADNVRYKLAPATTAKELLETSAVLGLMGVMFPDPIRGAYLLSLRKELEEKLRSGVREEGGWDLAALYALNGVGSFLLGQQPDLAFAGDGITRALESNKDIKVRPIAWITARGVHYGTLAATNELEPEKVGTAKVGPKRQAARERLESALRLMAEDPTTVPRVPLGHLTSLIDGLIATGGLLLAKSPKESSDPCAMNASARSSEEVKRNLRVLDAARDALLRDPAIRTANTTWTRRAGLLVLAASDVLDALSAPEGVPPKFAFPQEQARQVIVESLQEWTSQEVAVGVASLHALVREVSSKDASYEELLGARQDDMAKVLAATAELIGSNESGLARYFVAEGARVLSAKNADSISDTAPRIMKVAQALLEMKRQEHATLALLIAGSLGSENMQMMREGEKIALTHENSAAWYLAARGAVRNATPDNPLDAAMLERGLRNITDDACKVVEVEPLIEVGHAVRRYAQGESKSATDTLARVLAEAETRGLTVPRVHYQLDELLESGRIFRMSMHMSAGQGFINENSFSIGLDVFSTLPRSGLAVTMPAPPAEDAARYYAHVASLSAIYHLLDGRDGLAAHDAERMMNAFVRGVRLGDIDVHASDRSRWMGDLETNLYLAGELAAQRGHVLLAGDLWTMLFESQEKRPMGREVVPPETGWDGTAASVGIRGVRTLQALQPDVRNTRALIERAGSCDPKQRPTTPTNLETCADYRKAIGLWRAGVYDQTPSMRTGAKESCSREAMVLETLQDLVPGQPVPPRVQDKIANVIIGSARNGYVFDALTLLRHVRERSLCIPKLVEQARLIGRRPDVTPAGRVDWIGYTLTCPGRQADDSVWEDLALLVGASEKVADAQVTYQVNTAAVRYMVNLRAWDRLSEFSRQEGFVKLMNQGGPAGAAMALLIQHAAEVLAGTKPDLAATQDNYDVACIRFGNVGREHVCRELGTFRNRILRETQSDLRPWAEQLLQQAVGL